MDLTVIGGAISGLKTATDIAKGLVSVNTAVEVNSKAIELQRALLSAYADAVSAKETQSALQEEVRELKRQLSNSEEFAADMKRYKLDSPWPGSIVYALDSSMSNGEPAHYLCANCYQTKKKSILQVERTDSGFLGLKCPNCKAAVATKNKYSVAPQYAGVPPIG
jgi:hypothetical protein